MKLYDINERAAAIFAALEPDPETGEIVANEAELLEELERLAADKKELLTWVAKEHINYKAEAAAVQIEMDRLRKKKERAEARAERLLAILDRESGGRKTDLLVATLSYRKSNAVVIDDEKAVIDWCNKTREYSDAYRIEYRINKAVLRAAINDAVEKGTAVDGAHIEERTTASLR